MVSPTKTGYVFSTKNKKYEVYLCKDGYIEVYEAKNPKNGLTFQDRKYFTLFTNALADIIEAETAKEEIE